MIVTGYVVRRGRWECWETGFLTDQDHDIPVRASRLVFDLLSGVDQVDEMLGQLAGCYLEVFRPPASGCDANYLALEVKARGCNGSWVRRVSPDPGQLVRALNSKAGSHDPERN